jgi:hypothetical protein
MSRPVLWLFLLCAFLYAPGLGDGFVYDDNRLLVDNDRLIKASPRLAFTSDYWGDPPQAWRSMFYRPLAMLAYTGVYRVFGLSPFAYHGVSILLYAAAAASLYWLLIGLGYSGTISLAAAVLFVVHPLHVEAVAWMAGLPEMLSGALMLGSLACFAHGRRAWSWALGAAAILSKESALALPALIFVLAYLNCSAYRKWRAALEAAIPYALLAAAYLTARSLILPHPPREAADLFLTRWPAIPAVIAHYVKWLFWPWPLAIHYQLPGTAVTLAVLLAMAAWVVVMMKVESLRADLSLCAALMAIPLLLPIASSWAMSPGLQVQDRYEFISVAGVCLFAALILARLPGRGLLLACLFLAPLGILYSYLQLTVWESSETMWTHTLEVTPASKSAAISLGEVLFMDQRFSDAEKVYTHALRYHPGDKELEGLRQEMRKQRPAVYVPRTKGPVSGARSSVGFP